MSRPLAFIAIALFGAAAFVAGALLAAERGWLQPAVVVDIANRSGQLARRLEVRYEGNATNSMTSLPELPVNGTIRFPFHARGEGTYSVQVVLADGTLVSGGKRYVEPGYRMAETIGASQIDGAYVGLLGLH
jgi:hypothetical protein